MPPTPLKPCPFCGARAGFAWSDVPQDAEVMCSNPGCKVMVLAAAATEAEAGAKWNQRAKQPASHLRVSHVLWFMAGAILVALLERLA